MVSIVIYKLLYASHQRVVNTVGWTVSHANSSESVLNIFLSFDTNLWLSNLIAYKIGFSRKRKWRIGIGRTFTWLLKWAIQLTFVKSVIIRHAHIGNWVSVWCRATLIPIIFDLNDCITASWHLRRLSLNSTWSQTFPTFLPFLTLPQFIHFLILYFFRIEHALRRNVFDC